MHGVSMIFNVSCELLGSFLVAWAAESLGILFSACVSIWVWRCCSGTNTWFCSKINRANQAQPQCMFFSQFATYWLLCPYSARMSLRIKAKPWGKCGSNSEISFLFWCISWTWSLNLLCSLALAFLALLAHKAKNKRNLLSKRMQANYRAMISPHHKTATANVLNTCRDNTWQNRTNKPLTALFPIWTKSSLSIHHTILIVGLALRISSSRIVQPGICLGRPYWNSMYPWTHWAVQSRDHDNQSSKCNYKTNIETQPRNKQNTWHTHNNQHVLTI